MNSWKLLLFQCLIIGLMTSGKRTVYLVSLIMFFSISTHIQYFNRSVLCFAVHGIPLNSHQQMTQRQRSHEIETNEQKNHHQHQTKSDVRAFWHNRKLNGTGVVNRRSHNLHYTHSPRKNSHTPVCVCVIHLKIANEMNERRKTTIEYSAFSKDLHTIHKHTHGQIKWASFQFDEKRLAIRKMSALKQVTYKINELGCG